MTYIATDPIADMLARIRNAIAVNKSEVSMPHSRIKEQVAKILKDTNFIDDVKVEKAPIGKVLRININSPASNARITELERMSKPGRRLYSGADEIPKIKQGRGIVIISTSKGILTGAQAKSKGVGGELICKVY